MNQLWTKQIEREVRVQNILVLAQLVIQMLVAVWAVYMAVAGIRRQRQTPLDSNGTREFGEGFGEGRPYA